jgi:hypothetical protein
MMSNTENLLHLLQEYENTSISKEVLVEQIEKPKVIEDIQPKSQVMELEYSPQSVHYFKYKNYHYRREVDMNGNIVWEIIFRDLKHNIEDTYQIDTLEKRVLGIV